MPDVNHDTYDHTGIPGVGGGGSLGAWTSHSPTWTTSGTAPSIGNGTLTARYKALDANTYAYYLYLTFGSTTTAGSGTWTFTLPFTPITGRNQLLAGYIFDSGTDHKIAVARLTGGSATIPDVCPEGGNVITSTVPMTWASGDALILQGVVET